MLSQTLLDDIRSTAQNFWNQEVQTPAFSVLATGKEIGHRIADKVDDQTTNLVGAKHPLSFEHGPKGKRARSMGDFWLKSQGIFHPVNIKAGLENSNGQPNIVSLRKLLRALLQRQIDSYYLLIVKFQISPSLRATVYFVDILDYIDCVTFDSGPGQMMLKEHQFYDELKRGPRASAASLQEKCQLLVQLLEDGELRLIANRTKTLTEIRSLWTNYTALSQSQTKVHALDQSQWNLHEPD